MERNQRAEMCIGASIGVSIAPPPPCPPPLPYLLATPLRRFLIVLESRRCPRSGVGPVAVLVQLVGEPVQGMLDAVDGDDFGGEDGDTGVLGVGMGVGVVRVGGRGGGGRGYVYGKES